MIPPKLLLHSEKSCFLQISHTPSDRALRHLQLPCHRADGRPPADAFLVGPAPQIKVHGDGPVGQIVLVKLFTPMCSAGCRVRGNIPRYRLGKKNAGF